MTTLTTTVGGTTFQITIQENSQVSAPGEPIIVPYSLTVTGSAVNRSPQGTSFGTFNTNLPGATFSVSSYGGQAIQFGSGVIQAGLRPVDIMYRRSVTFVATASAPETTEIPATTLARSVTLPIVEAGSPTLTVGRAGGALSVTEFNAPLTPLDVITASGGTGPYRFSVITDGSPMEVAPISDTQAQLYMTGWCDVAVAASHTARIRAEDINGAFGYLDVTCAVTLFDITSIPDLVIFDPANATGTTTVTGLVAKQGSTNHTMVVPSGATAPTRGTITGPDGVVRPVLTQTGTLPGLACGPSYAGSSTTLGPLFNKTGVQGAVGTLIAVTSYAASAAYRNLLAVYNHNGAPGGAAWAANTTQGLVLGTGSDGTRFGGGWVDQSNYPTTPNVNAYPMLPTKGVAPNAWQIQTLTCDGYIGHLDDGRDPAWQSEVIPTNLSPDFNTANVWPGDRTLTCTSVRIGGGLAPMQPFTWAYMIASPRALTLDERHAIHAWLARRFPTPAAYAPVRKVTSAMVPTYWDDFKGWFYNDKWGYHFPTDTFPYGALPGNGETSIYIQENYPGITSVFPDATAFYDTSLGCLRIPCRYMTSAQIAWAQAYDDAHTDFNMPSALSNFPWRATGFRTRQRFAQWGGYFEVLSKNPKGKSLWPAAWMYPDTNIGGPFELDMNEIGGQQPTVTTLTAHLEPSGKDGVFVLAPHDQTQNYTLYAWDWVDNKNGTCSLIRYVNRERVGAPIVQTYAQVNKCMTLLLDLTIGGSFGAPDTYTINNAPHFYDVKWFRVYAYPDNDKGQPPLVLKKPVLTGTRGNGNTITATDAVFDWPGTSTYRWLTFDWTNGEVVISGATTKTLTDTTAMQGQTLIFEHRMVNSFWPSNTILSRQYKDPATTADLTLSTTSFTGGAAENTILAYISPASPGATVSITASDTSGVFKVAPDGRKLLAGPNYAVTTGSQNVLLTNTPRFGGPVKNQTIPVTIAGGGPADAFIPTTGWTLTNTNLTAELTSGGTSRSIQGTKDIAKSGDYSFTVTVVTLNTGASAPLTIGVADSAYTANSNLGNNNHSGGVYFNGNIVFNTFTTGGNVGALVVGDVVTVRVKANKLYFKRNSGPWMGTGSTADPSTDTGGIDISGWTGTTVKPTVYAFNNNTKFTGAF